MRIPVAKEGFPFILVFVVLTIGSVLLGLLPAAQILFFLTVFVVYFFRDPERTIPNEAKVVVSPADGKIVQIRDLPAGEALDEPAVQVSVFMSVFNVHVNRSPFEAKVLRTVYNPGKFLPANREKASLLNEQSSVFLDTSEGPLKVTQIAGLIARRIVCKVRPGDVLRRGERFGLIKFGSRVDLFLPKSKTEILTQLGDRVKAGETILARFSS